MVQSSYSIYQNQLTLNIQAYLHSINPLISLPHLPSQAQLTQSVDSLVRSLPQLPPAADQLKRFIISSVFSALVSELTNNNNNQSQSIHQPNPLLYHLLDLALGFVENELAPPELALASIEDILETATVKQAHFIFSYLESRVNRLTVGMLPDRGKGLIFLRMQNNLLRRLSKSLDTVFCGRILCFLSSVFPIAEKSGVNLRGAFNTRNVTKFDQFENSSISPKSASLDPSEGDSKNKRAKSFDLDPSSNALQNSSLSIPTSTDPNNLKANDPDSARTKALKSAADKREFYARFWSLQALLSNPPELFKSWNPDQPATTPATTTASSTTVDLNNSSGQPSTANLRKLKDGISKTLEVFGRMTKKELELGHNNLNPSPSQPSHVKFDHQHGFEQFFFPKFLTKSNLLDLEIADPYFRRQVLTQFLIILQYIRGFSPEERLKRASLPKPNRMSEIAYVYQPKDEAWVLKLSGEVWKTLYATPPHGEIFAMTVQQILIRESSWIMWKAGSCVSFEKPSLDIDPSPTYQRITSDPINYPHQVGTPALSKLWQNKVTSESIQHIDPITGVPDLETLHSKIQAIDKQLELLQADLTPATTNDPKLDAIKSQIRQLHERKAGLSWRALRIAQGSYLNLFGRIGMPADINKLMEMIKEANQRPTNAPTNRPISMMTASPLTPTNLHSLSGEAPTGMMEIETGPHGELEVGQTIQPLQRAISQEPSQPDVVMLDGESIMEGEKGDGMTALTSELDGELISDSISSAPGPTTIMIDDQQSPPPAKAPSPKLRPPIPTSTNSSSGSSNVPIRPSHQLASTTQPTSQPQHHAHNEVITLLAGGQESKKLSEIDEVIRRMEAEANRSAVGTPTPPPPTSSAPSSLGNPSNNRQQLHPSNSVIEFNRTNHHSHSHPHHHHHFFHPSLPNPPLMNNNNRISSNPAPTTTNNNNSNNSNAGSNGGGTGPMNNRQAHTSNSVNSNPNLAIGNGNHPHYHSINNNNNLNGSGGNGSGN